MKLLLAGVLCAAAQFWDPPKKEEPPPPQEDRGEEPAPSMDAGSAGGEGKGEEEPPPPEPPAGPPSLDDARASFGTVIETFLVQNTKEGVWNLRDKRTKKIRRLAFLAFEEKTVRGSSRPGLFRGQVSFKDVDSGMKVLMEMTVDMTGTQWRVAGARMLKAQK